METKKDVTIKNRWHINRFNKQIVLETSKLRMKNIYYCELTGETLKWKFIDKDTKTKFIITRKDNTLIIKGKADNLKINKVVEIDEAPWFQNSYFSLMPFIMTNKTSTEFWLIDPNSFKVFKMRAAKKGIEIISLNKKDFEAQKIQLSLTGFLEPFWHSYYWFQAKDGAFIRYEGVNGTAGTPKTIVELSDGTN